MMDDIDCCLVPLRQTICKGHKHLLVQRGQKKKGWSGSNLRLQWIYILYIQTNRLEKVKGWHSRVLNMVAPINFMGKCVYEQRH